MIQSNSYKTTVISFLSWTACLCLLCSDIYSQKPTSNWFLGVNAGLTFTGAAVSTTPNSQITSSLCTASISDSNGNLLFYSDGVTVWTVNHTVMANGSGLAGAGAFQPVVILPLPQSAHLYYIFTVGGVLTGNGLCYSIVDMSLASGSGSVIAKNISLQTASRDRVTATRHCNGQDYWVVAANYGPGPVFTSCLLTSAGIQTLFTTPTASVGPVLGSGQLKISPNGQKLGINGSSVTPTSTNSIAFYMDTRVFDFDPATGAASSQMVFMYGYYPSSSGAAFARSQGCEFSPTSRYFYFSSYNSIVKSDLCIPTFSSNAVAVYPPEASQEDTASKRAMQLAPDGRIYVALPGKTKVGYIVNSDNLNGPATYTDMSLGTYTCATGISHHPGFYYEKIPPGGFTYSVLPQSCLSASFTPAEICTGSGYTVSAWHWKFGDPASGVNNTSTLSSPAHVFSASGQYTVTLIRQLNCNKADTTVQSVIVSQPSLVISTASNICTSTTATASILGGAGPFTYTWSANSQTTAAAGFTSTGVHTVVVKDAGAGGCSSSGTVGISVVTLTAAVSAGSLSCNGYSNAVASASVSGGSGNYLYMWDNSPGTAVSTTSVLSAGIHTITVQELPRTCMITRTFVITQPPVLNMSLSALTPSSCVGGTILVAANISGGTAPYSYSWSSQATSAFVIISSQLPGHTNLSVTATDANGCVRTATTQVLFNAYPALSVTVTAVCAGDSLFVPATGAAQYTWEPGKTNGHQLRILPALNQTYTLTGEANGCVSQTLFPVVVNSLPVPVIIAGSTVCTGNNLHFQSKHLTGNKWFGPSGFVSSLQNPLINNVSPAHAGTYTLQVTDANGCVASDMITVIVEPLPLLSVSGKRELCAGESISLSASGATGYTWQPSNFTGPMMMLTPQKSMTVTVSGTSSKGCVSSQTAALVVHACLGVGDIGETDVKVYPNPAAERLCVTVAGNGVIFARVLNCAGQVVQEISAEQSTFEIEVAELPGGLYFLDVRTPDGKNRMVKFIRE